MNKSVVRIEILVDSFENNIALLCFIAYYIEFSSWLFLSLF